jgi:hypothetical protein
MANTSSITLVLGVLTTGSKGAAGQLGGVTIADLFAITNSWLSDRQSTIQTGHNYQRKQRNYESVSLYHRRYFSHRSFAASVGRIASTVTTEAS